MIEALEGWLAAGGLPNLHTVLVHFPVALLPTALLVDLACLVLRRWTWLDRMGVTLHVLGTLGAGAAYLAGERASGQMWRFSGIAQTTMADHEDLALLTLLAFVLVSLLRLAVSRFDRNERQLRIGTLRLVALVAAAVGVALLVSTAHHGGQLVYRYGMGVAVSQPAGGSIADGE